MPRKAKENIDEVKNKTVKKETKNKKVTSKQALSKKSVSKTNNNEIIDKKTPSKKSTKVVKKENSNSKTSKVSKKVDNAKQNKAVTKKKTNLNKNTSTKTTKKSVVKKTTSKKATTSKKDSVKKTQSKKKIEIVEYYDLPYRYNQTVVKILAQTPNTLFVYWDISDDDRKNYIEQYGEYFFNNTKPVLIVHNKTKNYDYEVDIDDFANSWYLRLIDSDCDYQIELGRRPINEYANVPDNYLYITTSNQIESPNDHILFDKLSHFVYFKNVKTNETIKKHTNLTLLNKIGKISSVEEFYKKLYPEEAINFDRLDLNNPSSNNPTSSFK